MEIKIGDKKYSRKHIGESHVTNEGYKVDIIDGGSKGGYCTIKIEDWVKEVEYMSIKRKNVKYPYHPSVHGKGYMGEGMYKSRINGMLTKSYSTWIDMLKRCYDPKYLNEKPTYINCTVCKEWFNFQVYADWFNDNYYELNGIKLELDKDLLVEGNKIYSSETCIFIPSYLNSFLANKYNSNTSGCTGVSRKRENNNKYVARITDVNTMKRIHLGYFNKLENADNSYVEARKIQCAKLIHKLAKDGFTNIKALKNIK